MLITHGAFIAGLADVGAEATTVCKCAFSECAASESSTTVTPEKQSDPCPDEMKRIESDIILGKHEV
jgi:hypothetical protein